MAFPEKVGFVSEFVRGQNRAENARFGVVGRRETKVERVLRLVIFEKWIDSSATAAPCPLVCKD